MRIQQVNSPFHSKPKSAASSVDTLNPVAGTVALVTFMPPPYPWGIISGVPISSSGVSMGPRFRFTLSDPSTQVAETT